MEPIRQILAVLLVLGLLGAALFWLRSKGVARFSVKGLGRTGNRQMRAIEQLRLTPQHSLHMVKVGDRVLLVALSPGGCSVLNTGDLQIQIPESGANR